MADALIIRPAAHGDGVGRGFGAVILFYTIVSARAGVQGLHSTDELSAEVNQVEEQVLTGSRNLVVLRNQLEKAESETASDQARVKSIAATDPYTVPGSIFEEVFAICERLGVNALQ